MKLKIGLKYCGGCNPEYDRVAVVRYIENRLQGKVEFVRPESKGVGLILAVEGCSTKCADLSAFQGMGIRIITSVKDAELIIKELKEQLESLPD